MEAVPPTNVTIVDVCEADGCRRRNRVPCAQRAHERSAFNLSLGKSMSSRRLAHVVENGSWHVDRVRRISIVDG